MGRQSNGAGSHIEGYNAVDEMDEESDAASSSGNEWDGRDEDNEYGDGDGDEEMSDVESYSPDGSDNDGNGYGASQRSLVVQLRYGKAKRGLGSSSPAAAPDTPTNPAAGQAPGPNAQPIPIQPEASEANHQHPFAVVVSPKNESTAPAVAPPLLPLPVNSDKKHVFSPEPTAPPATTTITPPPPPSVTSSKDTHLVSNIVPAVKQPQVSPMDTNIPRNQETTHPPSGQNGVLPG
ncbi:hypothetical protein EMPG_15912 [Blastomyces silverae]|uniref:Uncharacterized protein n=1 Tax=Blastomyces silverae TaxID=2060906 RepID=A0A0H1BC00_9EURO|nr:hypothetical protein EMPG_15912 [Blastomyces silverae]